MSSEPDGFGLSFFRARRARQDAARTGSPMHELNKVLQA